MKKTDERKLKTNFINIILKLEKKEIEEIEQIKKKYREKKDKIENRYISKFVQYEKGDIIEGMNGSIIFIDKITYRINYQKNHYADFFDGVDYQINYTGRLMTKKLTFKKSGSSYAIEQNQVFKCIKKGNGNEKSSD